MGLTLIARRPGGNTDEITALPSVAVPSRRRPRVVTAFRAFLSSPRGQRLPMPKVAALARAPIRLQGQRFRFFPDSGPGTIAIFRGGQRDRLLLNARCCFAALNQCVVLGRVRHRRRTAYGQVVAKVHEFFSHKLLGTACVETVRHSHVGDATPHSHRRVRFPLDPVRLLYTRRAVYEHDGIRRTADGDHSCWTNDVDVYQFYRLSCPRRRCPRYYRKSSLGYRAPTAGVQFFREADTVLLDCSSKKSRVAVGKGDVEGINVYNLISPFMPLDWCKFLLPLTPLPLQVLPTLPTLRSLNHYMLWRG